MLNLLYKLAELIPNILSFAKSVFHDDDTVRHLRKFLIMSYNDEGLLEVVAQIEKQLV